MADTCEFAIGDKVVCVRGPGTGQLQVGRIYEVRDMLGGGPLTLLCLNILPGMMWGCWRFEKVDD